tara:strand:+ start:607 stop:978 length:372 start_codon:yes stop_codon:yes gene_type:complete
MEEYVTTLENEQKKTDHYISILEDEFIEMDVTLSLYTAGLDILNDSADVGIISVIRSNACDALVIQGPRYAKMAMLRDICQWDIGGECNGDVLKRLTDVSQCEVNVKFIEDMCAWLTRLINIK